MKRILSKIVTVSLVIALITTLNPVSVFASSEAFPESQAFTENTQTARDCYYNLSPEAKAIFEDALTENPVLLAFHKQYVDPSSKLTLKEEPLRNGPLSVLSAELAALALPSSVTYCLEAVGAGIVAAAADGLLPVGDILLAAAAVSAAAVIAANWNDINSLWPGIVAAFTTAFYEFTNIVQSAFSIIRNDIDDELENNPCVTVDGDTIILNGTTYHCTSFINQALMTQMNRAHAFYYPAVRYEGTVMVSPTPLSIDTAKLIMLANNTYAGVFANGSNKAQTLCVAAFTSAVNHSSSAGHQFLGTFFPHWHGKVSGVEQASHCWYYS